MNNWARIDGQTEHLRQPQFPVAIVGYSYRMPGGIRTDDDFWQLLSKRKIIQEPITERYGRGYKPIGEYSGPGRVASPYEGLIRDDGERLFDRSLFGMSHNEMMATDPQLRMLLSCTWESVERSGWDLHSLRNSPTGVFIGGQVPAAAGWRPLRGVHEFSVTSISLAMMANRISYHFNLMGPSITYCTALFGQSDRPALGIEFAALRRLRTGSGRVGQLSRQRPAQHRIQRIGRDQPRRQVPFIRCGCQRVHAIRRRVRLCDQTAGESGARWRPHIRSHRGNSGQCRRNRRRQRRACPGGGISPHRPAMPKLS